MSEANTFIKPSQIHGLGLFAKSDIRKGQRVVQGMADFSYQDEWIRYVKKWKTKSFCYNNGFCMVNHSETPNIIRRKSLMMIASRNIKAGEEITEDYHKLPDSQNPFKGEDLMEFLWDAKHEQLKI